MRGLENLGIVDAAAGWLRSAPQSATTTFQVATGTALAANVVNNLPAALIARSILLGAGAHSRLVLAALVGADAGPMITPFGSLATMLVLALARRAEVEVRTSSLVLFGLWAVPLIVLVTTAVLVAMPLGL